MINFDLIDYLDDRGITYWREGKNVTAGWINVSCPFCDDPSNHLGLNPKTKGISCWRCSTKGSVIKFIMSYERISFEQAELIILDFPEEGADPYEPKSIVTPEALRLPSGASKDPLPVHTAYLKKRGYNPLSLSQRYRLKFTQHTGAFKFRIIIPFYQDRKLITYSSVDVTGKASVKYKHQESSKAIVPVKQSLYNIDSVKNIAVIVEGVFDVWRLGEGAVGLMGKKHTREQLFSLYEKDLDGVYVMLDADALREAEDLANELTTKIKNVNVIELEKDDPDKLSPKAVNNLRQQIFN